MHAGSHPVSRLLCGYIHQVMHVVLTSGNLVTETSVGLPDEDRLHSSMDGWTTIF